MRFPRIAIALLLGAGTAEPPSARAQAHETCEIEEAQRLFGQQPRQTPVLQRLLSACVASGSTDYRVYMFLGVLARDAGDRVSAIDYLREAHRLDPSAVNPSLELAFTLEDDHPDEAHQIYGDLLARDPDNRAALLGQARVDRAQYRLDAARATYERLRSADPGDVEALNGLAWLELAHRNRERGRAGFETVLSLEPENEEAKTGLSMSESVYRHVIDLDTTYVSTEQGDSWGFGARAFIGLTPFDTLELAETHFTDELVTVGAAGVAVLPSDNLRIGWHRLVPLRYGVSLIYDYRGHDVLPTEHWIDGSISIYLTDDLRWFGGYRESFGARQWDARLFRTGLTASLSPSWEVTATVWNAAQAIFNDYQTIWSWTVDFAYSGPRNTLVVAGVGYTPTIDNLDLHARAIVPVTDRIALQLVTAYSSINVATNVTVGLRIAW